jgi:hypothetical protein
MSGLMSGTVEQVISSTSLAKDPSDLYKANFAYSIWYYIDDYNYKNGDEKILLIRSNNAAAGSTATAVDINTYLPCPAITFAPNTNDMYVYINTTASKTLAKDTLCSTQLGSDSISSGVAANGYANGKSSACCKTGYVPSGMTAGDAATPAKVTNYAGYIFDPNGPGSNYDTLNGTDLTSRSSSVVVNQVGGSPVIMNAGSVQAATTGWWKGDTEKAVPAIDIGASAAGADFGNGCDKDGHYKRFPDAIITGSGISTTDYPAIYTYGASASGYPLNKHGMPIISTTGTAQFTAAELAESLDDDFQKITISNIPIQAWTLVTVNVYQQQAEVWINGKLRVSRTLPSIANIFQDANVYITPKGGFSGWSSKFAYYPYNLNPQQIGDLYLNGFGGSWLSNIFGSYSLQVSLLENGATSSSVTI